MNAPLIRYLALPAALVLTGLAAAPSYSQETPSPAPEVMEGTRLAFQYRIGGAQTFRGTMKMDAALSPEGGPAGLPTIPLTVNAQVAYTEKVTGTRKGTGTLALKLDSLTTNTEVMGRRTTSRFKGGKLTASVNGQPVSTTSPDSAADIKTLQKPGLVRRSAQGITTSASAGTNFFQQVFGSNSALILQFPDHPVKVGDTWETKERVRPAVLGGGRMPFVMPEIEFRYTHTLKSFQTRNGRKQALVETTGTGAPMGDGTEDTSLNQSVSGTSRFDIARGAVISSQYNVILSMRLGLPQGTAVQEGGPTGIRLDGTMDVVLAEAAPASAPAKKAKR